MTGGSVSESERVMGGRPVPAKSDEAEVIVTILSPAVAAQFLGDETPIRYARLPMTGASYLTITDS